jgi:hypothetical protein
MKSALLLLCLVSETTDFDLSMIAVISGGILIMLVVINGALWAIHQELRKK